MKYGVFVVQVWAEVGIWFHVGHFMDRLLPLYCNSQIMLSWSRSKFRNLEIRIVEVSVGPCMHQSVCSGSLTSYSPGIFE